MQRSYLLIAATVALSEKSFSIFIALFSESTKQVEQKDATQLTYYYLVCFEISTEEIKEFCEDNLKTNLILKGVHWCLLFNKFIKNHDFLKISNINIQVLMLF